jgi:hypothetical protein
LGLRSRLRGDRGGSRRRSSGGRLWGSRGRCRSGGSRLRRGWSRGRPGSRWLRSGRGRGRRIRDLRDRTIRHRRAVPRTTPRSRLDLLAHGVHWRNTVASGRVALEVLQTVLDSHVTDDGTVVASGSVTAAAADGAKDAVGGVALDTDLTAVGAPGWRRRDHRCGRCRC